ncbi:DUF2889 domain-containing protein [Ideonella azotifigens]|uniref:DUF2889 domain-containing protein n=1 Tax=Ideonella azotifigens TaxID=513160 RepID=A0ABN1JMM5_9BURK|nr:DUF2889 domain-containing protein [Ideonella azotifigens]MCD2339838.1 DUF2889 domain-containing protein [Ideonella azotifigens]
MPLPAASPTRQLKHHRAISVTVFARDDGLWEVDARITDIKTHPISTANGVRPAGEPVHDLLLRLVVDTRFNILEAGAESRATPYPGHCNQHGDAYGRLAGLNLMQGFKRALRERVGGVRGCTHLTEMGDLLPTAVVQAFAGEVLDTHGQGDEPPFQLDRCHALVTDGEVVRLHYPRWFRQAAADETAAKLRAGPAGSISR